MEIIQIRTWKLMLNILNTGHLGEVWALAVSPNGKWLATSGKDRSVRLWEKTQEILVLDDERETEREEAAEAEAGETQPIPGEQVITVFLFSLNHFWSFYFSWSLGGYDAIGFLNGEWKK